MMSPQLRTFCILTASLAILLLIVGSSAIAVTHSMRSKYGPNLSAFQSARRFMQDYWLDGDVTSRTDPESSPILPTNSTTMPSHQSASSSEMETQLSTIDRIAGRVLLTRQTGTKAPVILPCELTNGGLPLLMVRIPGSPPTKVVLDTASDYLLIADINECKKCSVKIYGGAQSDQTQESSTSRIKVYFGSQIDDVQFQTRDIQLGAFTVISQVPVGIVKSRETRIEHNTHTFNIMGIGAMGMTSAALGVSMIERLLAQYDQPKVFGFYFGADLRDGLFVLGYAAKKASPILTLPLYPHRTKPYYLVRIASIDLIPHPELTDVEPMRLDNATNQFPEALVDTGANYAALPASLEPYFAQKGRVHELHFNFKTPAGIKSLRIPHSRLYNRKGREVFYFAQDRFVIGTFIMSLFSYVEFDFMETPALRFWI